MIYAYGVTQRGTYHVKKNIVCQDAHRIIKCGDSCAVAAVADGLGSEAHSDVASKLAVEVSAGYCAERIDGAITDSQPLKTIRDSFASAQQRIEQAAADRGHDLDQYDTTLSLAILKGSALYYGHSGDSGIVALTAAGLYQKVTEQQRDEEGRVFPLYFGNEKWVFAKYPDPVASVFLASDGIFETLFPLYLRGEPVDIHVALARYFMDASVLGITELGEEAVREKIGAFLDGIPDAQVNDDKTVVVLVNPDIVVGPQPPEYYAEPDWAELKRRHDEAWRRAAYPHLFKDETPSGGAVFDRREEISEASSDEGASGKSYQLAEKPFSSGGEGDIYGITSMPGGVVKVYHADRVTQELEEKLLVMYRHPPSREIFAQIAWPVDVVYDTNGAFLGFVMLRLNITHELTAIYAYPPKKNISYKAKIIIAQNICAVISEIHKAGFVFGDFNPKNIGIDLNICRVAFLDTDSYHIVDGAHTYRCNVCLDGYVAPELLKKCEPYKTDAYAQAPLPTFTQETDNFALAIHIFRLLMNGYTPFNGIRESENASTASPGRVIRP